MSFETKVKIDPDISIGVSAPNCDRPDLHNEPSVYVNVIAFVPRSKSVTTMTICLNESQAHQLADAINAALGHAWPKEF